ncbi:MAG TPA: tetratricopeptide repeat protein, partial [candidate division Zixibacteria bacterium]|nr:tetratricopeptide repeat protein [candidate division Zixibacteria bacterium]
MSRKFRLLAIIAVLAGGFTCSIIHAAIASAASGKNPGSADLVKGNEQLLLARQLMAQQDYQTAADILEVLYEQEPTNSIISNSLKSCYEQLKQYVKGELLLRKLLEQFPDNISYKINLAENLVRQGKLDEGKSLYIGLIDGLQTENKNFLANVVRSMIDCDLDEDALAIIEKLRTQFSNPALMAVEKAGILEQKRKYDAAALEYFGVLRDTANVGNTAEKGLQSLLDFVESAQPTEKALLTKIKVDSSGRALKVLSAYYLKTGRYDDAFTFAIKQDSATGFSGASLIQYLHGCMERKLYGQALRMSEYVITHLNDKHFAGEFYYRYAEALEELGNYDRAIKVYDTIFATFPRQEDRAESAYRIGRIYLDRLNNPSVALTYFDSVVKNFQLGFAYNSANLSIPRAYLQMGDLKRSRQEHQRIRTTRHNPEVSEELDFNMALLDLFEHSYDSCGLALKRLMVDFPQGYYINDAVQLSFVISQAGDAKELLDSYAGALLAQKMKLYDSTISRFVSLADDENKALADIALYRLAEIVLAKGDSTGAVK